MLEGLSSGWGARDSKGWGFGNFSLRPAPAGWENQGIPGLGAFEDRGWRELSGTTRSRRSGISVPPPRGVCAPAPPGDESPGRTGKARTPSNQPRPTGWTRELSAQPGQPRPRNAPGGGAGTHGAVHVAVKSGTGQYPACATPPASTSFRWDISGLSVRGRRLAFSSRRALGGLDFPQT